MQLIRMQWLRKKFAWSALVAAVLVLPAFADIHQNTTVPGTLNYVEGQVNLGSQPLDAKSVGSVQAEPGQSINTNRGKAELLLTPGVFLRLAENSSVEMISPSLTSTQLTLNQGEALVEVDEIYPENDIRINENGTTTQIKKTGLYDFDADHNVVRVFDGMAMVRDNDHEVKVKGGRELSLSQNGKPKASKFDRKALQSTELYRWSSLRSDYLAEANVNAARIYFADGGYGPGWIGAGWYWSPWYSAYTFIPGDGIFYNPFGWGFYSPFWAYRAPLFYGGRYPHHGVAPVRVAHSPAPYRNRTVHSGFASGSRGFSAGHRFSGSPRGFAGGGGFHGGFAGAHFGGR
jgi:hypothetical protein